MRCLALIGREEARAHLNRWNASPDPGLSLRQALLDAFENPLDVVFFRDAISEPFLGGRLSLDQRNCLRDRHLPRLLDFGPHTGLNLAGTAVTDAGLQHLSGLTNLEWLDLSGTAIGDGGLQHLSGLKNLQHLDLSRTRVGDTEIERFRDFRLQAGLPEVRILR